MYQTADESRRAISVGRAENDRRMLQVLYGFATLAAKEFQLDAPAYWRDVPKIISAATSDSLSEERIAACERSWQWVVIRAGAPLDGRIPAAVVSSSYGVFAAGAR
jgi:hypothetical protein